MNFRYLTLAAMVYYTTNSHEILWKDNMEREKWENPNPYTIIWNSARETHAEVWLLRTAVTNWSGFTIGTNELGVISTNYIVQVFHNGKTNEILVKEVPTTNAVWRPVAKVAIANDPNVFYRHLLPGVIITNYLYP